MIVKNTLNNMALRNLRKDRIYETVITDLAMLGIVPKDKAEMLLGYEIPEFLQLPDGTSIKREEKPAQNKMIDKLKKLEA